jgi:hypothetical protein
VPGILEGAKCVARLQCVASGSQAKAAVIVAERLARSFRPSRANEVKIFVFMALTRE